MAFRDYAEAFGQSVNQQGLASRRFQSPLTTGLASFAGGLGSGLAMTRALAEARRMREEQHAFEADIGIPYGIFAKLSGPAQVEILKSVGKLDSPETQPMEQFGGRSLRELETQGAPGRTEMSQPSGVFEGQPGQEVQTSPPMAPLSVYGKSGTARSDAVDRYLNYGQEQPLSPEKQSLIDYRAGVTERGNRTLTLRESESKARVGVMQEQKAALRELTRIRKNPKAQIEPWEAEVARQMGVPIPEGVVPTRESFNAALQYNRAVGAVVSKIDRLSQLAREAEITEGREMTYKEIETLIQQETSSIPALAGTGAVQIVKDGFLARMKALRSQANLWNTPAGDEEEVPEEDVGEMGEGREEDFR